MGRFQRSDRGGQVDPGEALRRAREAVSRERAERGEGHGADRPAGNGDDLERVGDALRGRAQGEDGSGPSDGDPGDGGEGLPRRA